MELHCKCLLIPIVWALNCLLFPASSYGNEQFNHLTVNDGLAHTDANCITQDSVGMIWVGTYSGLQSYDGYTFRTFDYYQEEQNVYESHNRVLATACSGDRLWIGSESGLTCFDLTMRRYIPYYIIAEEKTGAVSPKGMIRSVCFNGKEKTLLVYGEDGISVLRENGDTLYLCGWKDEKEFQRCRYLSDYQTYGGEIWTLSGNELIALGLDEGKMRIKQTLKLNFLRNADETVHTFYLSDKGLYICTSNGFYHTKLTGEKQVRYLGYGQLGISRSLVSVQKMLVDSEGCVWCAYDEGLLEIRNPFSDAPISARHLQNNSRENASVRKITDIMIDKYDNLWVASSSWGVFFRNLADHYFTTLSNEKFLREGFSRNEIVNVCEQRGGILWMIVEYGSLFRFDTQTGKLSFILSRDRGNVQFQTLCLSEDERKLYIGSNRGISVYDIPTGKISPLSAGGNPLNYSIADLKQDKYGRLWAGTWGGGALCLSHIDTAPVLEFKLDIRTDSRILSNLVSFVYLRGNDVFLGTNNGLNRISLDEYGKIHSISSYQAVEESDASLSTNFLASMDCENDSVYWIGTIGGGLNRMVIRSGRKNDYKASRYTVRNGLASNDCEIVMVDRNSDVWIGANNIERLDPKTGKIYSYGQSSGLSNNSFKINVSCKGHDGTFYMGGLYGLTAFVPENLTGKKEMDCDLVFTDLSVGNRPIVAGTEYEGNRIMDKAVDCCGQVTLNYRQNNFSVSFAALGYSIADQVLYRYRLRGQSDTWNILPRNVNQVYFSDLPYGKYKLEIQYSVDNGAEWHAPGKTLNIAMLAPWWLSGWAKTAYVLLAAVILAAMFRHYEKEQKLKKENEIQKILLEQDEEKYQAKMRFFMNASHELKTPLTLVMLAGEKLEAEGKGGEACSSILRNTRKMLGMISELVDIRKTDLGIVHLELSRVNLSEMLYQLYREVLPWAERKGISVTYNAEKEDVVLDADKDKMGKLIVNLLTNAIKYTNNGGRIDITFRRGKLADVTPCYRTVHTEGETDTCQPACILTVKDTGIGISPESIRLIYERFFQVNGNSHAHLGSGIGLAVVKNIVLQHKGVIIVSSERMVGSEFVVVLPIHNDCAGEAEEQDFDTNTFIKESYNELPALSATRDLSEEKERKENPDRPTLLIVEDNAELRHILEEHFSAEYNVHTADDGRKGLKKCLSLYPDIIISDVMMPEMDGIEMCRRIRNDLSVASIPIILLTAKGNVENQIEGYESGADLYIAKPFSMKLLDVNLRHLLAWKERRLKGIADELHAVGNEDAVAVSQANLPESPANVSGSTQALQERLKKIINENLGEPDLSPDFLAAELGMSRTKLYREVKKIDGMSLGDYVRNARLTKAADLLLHSSMNVQEIMTDVGFVNNSHFSKIFKLKFALSPTEYREKNR